MKTMTFQISANLADTLIFGEITGADPTTNALFLIANSSSAVAVYFPYELAWDYYGPPPKLTTVQTLTVKTTLYQLITVVRNLALSYIFSGELLSSVGFAIAAIAVDTTLYLANEHLWDFMVPRTRD